MPVQALVQFCACPQFHLEFAQGFATFSPLSMSGNNMENTGNGVPAPSDFIGDVVTENLREGKYQQIVTRFPPEPNGYLHIGHAKSICLNFGITKKYGGYTNLRFDDTNPVTEETEYVDSIKDDVHWLGFEWKNGLYASDYFPTLYGFAVKLIK